MKFGGIDKKSLAFKNTFYDSEPTKVAFGYTKEELWKLRERKIDKELAGHFHFKPKNYLEKITDQVNNRNACATVANNKLYDKRLYDKNGPKGTF